MLTTVLCQIFLVTYNRNVSMQNFYFLRYFYFFKIKLFDFESLQLYRLILFYYKIFLLRFKMTNKAKNTFIILIIRR